MRHLISILFAIIPLYGAGQTNSLSELLWSKVKPCYSMFEDVNDDGIPDFDKIDDSKNGYLWISGSWPTCGCSCSSTVGAYKNDNGKYIILQSDKTLCSWERKISSNKEFKDILPVDFGVKSFISEGITDEFHNPIFFIDFEIPRIGTDTKVKIELIAFGLKPEGSELICYEYREKERCSNCFSLYRLKDIAEDIQDVKTLDYLMDGDFNKISQVDNEVISKAIGNDDSRFRTKEEIQKYLLELKKIYNIYEKLDFTELTLGWNRQAARFYIKERGTKKEKVEFRFFLINNKYWSPVC